MESLTFAHIKLVRCIVIFFLAQSNAESSLSANDVKYCDGVDYTETIGQQFLACAETHQVALIACNSEYQTELEFAIANGLYETCLEPHCVYYSMELAFHWNVTSLCYSEKENTGVEDQCWESEYNEFYTSGLLLRFLATFCFATAAPSYTPTSYPSAYPTQWCDGEEYTDAIGTKFVSCGKWYVPGLTLDACDEDYQDALYFGIANELYATCYLPQCVWANMDYAFFWNADKECYAELYNDTNAECWSGSQSMYYANGNLKEDLHAICFDTVTPTPIPTETPSSPPTEDPTLSPTTNPTTHPTNTPTTKPTINPTQTPTTNPTTNPTQTPTMVPSQTPTATPTMPPTSTPTNTPTNYPTAFPSQRPTAYPTTASPTVLPTEKPSLNPTMPWVQSTSQSLSVLVSANVSCITKQQIADTIFPIGRVVNVTGQEIGIDSYSKLSSDITGFEDDGYFIRWLVVVPTKDINQERLELINAVGITKVLTQEFDTEFNNSNCSIIVENLTWRLMDVAPMTPKSDSLLVPFICGVIIFLLCIFCIGICHRRCKSDTVWEPKTSADCPYEEHQDPAAESNVSDKAGKAGKAAGTTIAGGAVTSTTKGKKSKSVSFICTVNEAGSVQTNGKKTRGSNGKKRTRTAGTNGEKATKTRGTNGTKVKTRGFEV